MDKEETFYINTGKKITGSEQSQMFGKPCFKLGGKAFICFFNKCMVFKLKDNMNGEALSLDGASLFDPSGKKRPMREWVQVPFDYKNKWQEFADAAAAYVSGKK